MTIQEYKKITKAEFYKMFGYPKYLHYNEAREKYKQQIFDMECARPGIDVVLHHSNPGCDNYEMWECVPMYEDEHVLLHQQHCTVYQMGRVESAYIKAKRSASLRGIERTAEWRAKASAANKGKKHSKTDEDWLSFSRGQRKRFEDPEQRALQAVNTGKHWFNNGIKSCLAFECPDGFVPGRLPGCNGYQSYC